MFQPDFFGPWLERLQYRTLPSVHRRYKKTKRQAQTTERDALSRFAHRSLPLASLEAHRGFLGLPPHLFLDAASCPLFSNLVLVQHTDLGLGHDGPAASHSPSPVHDPVRTHAMTVACRHRTGGTANHGLSPSHDRGHVLPVHGRGRDPGPGPGHGHNLCPGPFPFLGRGRGGRDHGRAPCPCPSPSLCLGHVDPCRALCLTHDEALCACG